MGTRAKIAWRTAVQCALHAQQTAVTEIEHEFLIRMRDNWIRLATRCEFLDRLEGELLPALPRTAKTRQH
jgi:hypothetical protein